MKKVLVLGCTGSIGSQTLDIIRHNPDRFSVAGLSCNSNRKKLDALCKEFKAPGSLFSSEGIKGLSSLIKNSGADIAVNGIAGSAGLLPSVCVIENRIPLALANKETVVMAWDIVKSLAQKNSVPVIPVDSEHSAVFCLINQAQKKNVSEIVITASGGPFRTYSREQLKTVTLQQALKHPTWSMGPKITVDSASLANKGLEVIEACRLFDMKPDRVTVVVHPQSLVHSLIRTTDGMLYAQISDPDMRHPIQNALTWPDMSPSYLEPFSLAGHDMSFFQPRTSDFKMLPLAYSAAEKGASYTIAYNAANEVAVSLFMQDKIGFLDIASLVEEVLGDDWTFTPKTIEEVMQADSRARQSAERAYDRLKAVML